MAVSACGASSEPSSPSAGAAAATPGEVPAPSTDAAALEFVPSELKASYEGVSTFANLGPNPYEDWTPPKPPWKFCLSESVLSSPYRQAQLRANRQNVERLRAEGLADGPLTVLNSNGDINLQGSQINQLVSRGCNVITALPSSPTGYCKAVDNARANDVLFFTINATSDCKNAVGSAENTYTPLRDLAKWLAEEMGGKGSVVMLRGIPGVRIDSARTDAAKAVFDSYPDIKVEDIVRGDWSAPVAKGAMLKFLATHPGKIDAVFDSGAMSVPAAQAFKQTGRPAPKQNNFAADCAWLAYWKQNKLTSASFAEGPRTAVNEAYRILVRMLKGEKAAVNYFIYQLPRIDNANLDEWYRPGMNVNSTCFAESKGEQFVPSSHWDPLFERGS